MATIVTHALLGAAAYRLVDGGRDPRLVGPLVAGALSVLPDADALLMRWIPYSAAWGHRGMTHSLVFAAVVGALAAAALAGTLRFPGGFLGLACLFFAVTASHGVLDALTDGGLGIAFFAPFDDTRHFLPVTPIPVAPLGVYLAHPRTWYVLAIEFVMFAPLALWMWTARQPLAPPFRIGVWAALAASAVVWALRVRASA